MPTADFFRLFGFFIRPNFLEPDACRTMIEEVRSRACHPATVSDGVADAVDEETRRTRIVELSPESEVALKQRLLDLRPDLQSHFGIQLVECQSPHVLHYEVGDFFAVHQDSGSGPAKADYVKARKVSVILFLNDEVEEPASGSYTGGALSFNRLIDDKRLTSAAVPLRGEAGLLVAFRSDVPHQVSPVTSGDRFTVVTWFV